MNQVLKKFIKVELHRYKRNKDIINQVNILDMIGHRSLVRKILMLHVVDSALEQLPNEIQEYAEIRYFNRRDRGYSMLASVCNASERTVKRWDRILLRKVAEQLLAMENAMGTRPLFGTKLAPSIQGNMLECD